MHVLIPALHRPSQPTGVCRYAANLAQCLAETISVRQVTLIVGKWQTHYFKDLFSSEKIKLINVDIENNSTSRNLWFLLKLPKLSNQLQPDIVHMSFPFPFIRTLFSVPIISTIHDLYPFECPENFGYPYVWFNQLFLRLCVLNSHGISCVSQVTLKELKLYFSSLDKPTDVIYNSVDFSNTRSVAPSQLGNQPEFPFLLWVAQHRKNKNIDLLLEAYNQLLQARILSASTRLILVGSPGPETNTLYKQINSLGLQERVLMLSSISDHELHWLYQHCNVFVAPSSTEGFCIPLAEARYFGCRVVCSDIPIFREVASLNCVFFDLQLDPIKNLVEAIAQSLKLPCNQHPKEDLFSRAHTAQQYLKLYEKVSNLSLKS
ncbi:MAG: glycosyltransferase family 4 protein [Tildeniella nuda ZEHNDER 1965/U140]|jgi:glycosyltransferase involved in cell wall biosynthesis|nr:glycosyltransferase family 4 protein [Tildeniella nuda ZEHNDER 1965/U140]